MALESLSEWEEYLRPQVEQADLLGEILLSQEEVARLGRLIGDLVRRQGWTQAEQFLEEQYPCSFAVFMVALGASGYEAGRFWPSVRESTGLDHSAPIWQWGPLFERIVARLPVFQFPPIGGHRYVALILAQCGIPDYSLADFFQHFIEPLIWQPEYAALPVEEFIRQRLRHYTAVYLTDQPVCRFLETGGPLAVDFVERCLEMATRYAETGEVPSPEEMGLPPRVVDEYRAWLEGRPRPVLRRQATYRSPVLSIDPWGEGVFLHLPSQPVPALRPGLKVCWEIAEEIVPVEMRRTEGDWRTEPGRFPLRQPASEYVVRLCFQEQEPQCLREWCLPGLSEDHPILWFRPEDGSRVPPREYLPPERLWLLRPPDVSLEADPPDALRVTEYLPRQPYGWSDFIGEEIDLSRVRRLLMRRDGRLLREYPIWGRSQQEQPTLEGEHRLPIDDGGPPFYVGCPPCLRFPLPGGSFRPGRWHITVRNEGPALPEANVSLSPEHLVSFEDAVILDFRDILGERPMGTYRVNVRGPLGSRADLSFRVLPLLEIVGHETFYPPEQGEAEARLLVETDARTAVQLPSDAPPCRIVPVESGRDRTLYEVVAGPERESIPLRFVRQTDGGDTVSVPLSVPIRRLRWRVILNPEALRPEWRTTPLTLPLDALAQSREPLLLVDLFGGIDRSLGVVLCLEDEETRRQEVEGHPRRGHPYLRFDLTPFRDTLRHTPSAYMVFSLLLRGVPGEEEKAYPVLRITRRFEVQQARADTIYEGDRVYLRLRWEATVRVRGLRARLWPVWRPWEGPVEIPIPDEATAEHWCVLPASQLPPGRYLLEFDPRDPWAAEPVPPPRPQPDAPAVTPVLIPPGAVRMRLEELQLRAVEEGLSFPLVLETALIRRECGQEHLASQALQWGYEHLYEDVGETEIRHILAFVQTVAGNPDLEVPARMKMATARRVRRVIEAFRQGTLPESLYREYLKWLPPSSQWSADTCELLLTVDDEPVRRQAAMELLQREHPEGARTVVRWALDRTISEEDAVNILQKSLSLAVQALQEVLPHPAAFRLLEALIQQYPEQIPVLRPGYWVRCRVGWGKVKRIEAADGAPREFFIISTPEPGLRLHVLLRAHEPKWAEEIVIDLDAGTMTFRGAERVYTCTKCRRFSSAHQHLITEWHDRQAHGGISPTFRVESTTTLRQTPSLEEVAPRPPPNPWI